MSPLEEFHFNQPKAKKRPKLHGIFESIFWGGGFFWGGNLKEHSNRNLGSRVSPFFIGWLTSFTIFYSGVYHHPKDLAHHFDQNAGGSPT